LQISAVGNLKEDGISARFKHAIPFKDGSGWKELKSRFTPQPELINGQTLNEIANGDNDGKS
jgi:hypothetical protein